MIKKLFTKVVLFAAFLTAGGFANAQTTLSDSAFASLITCGPGNDYYLAFGHTSIRVCDPASGIDRVYNYGTFDFDTPNLYWNFVRGYLNYCVSACSYRNFVLSYQYEGRSLVEQRLRLTPDECRRLFDALEDNCLPDKRFYLYDFFRDNCATRARDMIVNALDNPSLFVNRTTDTNRTYRQMIYPYTVRLKWWQFGVDMLLGMRCDWTIFTKCYNRRETGSSSTCTTSSTPPWFPPQASPLPSPRCRYLPKPSCPTTKAYRPTSFSGSFSLLWPCSPLRESQEDGVCAGSTYRCFRWWDCCR